MSICLYILFQGLSRIGLICLKANFCNIKIFFWWFYRCWYWGSWTLNKKRHQAIPFTSYGTEWWMKDDEGIQRRYKARSLTSCLMRGSASYNNQIKFENCSWISTWNNDIVIEDYWMLFFHHKIFKTKCKKLEQLNMCAKLVDINCNHSKFISIKLLQTERHEDRRRQDKLNFPPFFNMT